MEKKSKTMNAQRASMLAAAVASAVVGSFFAHRFTSKSIEYGSIEHLQKLAGQIGKGLPTMVDNWTELAAVEAGDHVIIYEYRLPTVEIADSAKVKVTLEKMKPDVITRNCTNPDTWKDFLSKGVSMKYNYTAQDRSFIASIEISPSDCKK